MDPRSSDPNKAPEVPSLGAPRPDPDARAEDVGSTVRAVLAPPEHPDELGRLGSFRVLEVLGRGGMGIVFRAEDTELKRQIALKLMLPHLAADVRARVRFRREAEAQARVDHEHVAVIHRVGEVDGVPFIAMPLLRGQTLAAALRSNPRPPPAEAVRIARAVAEGLSAAHAAGLIHRDIKPGNVWLEGAKRHVRILDFGLARAGPEAGSGGSEPITSHGATIGTPAFMSPEQAEGRAVDHRADLFALGVVLYQMATGQLPFNGTTAFATLVAVTGHEPSAPAAVAPDVPPLLSDLIQRLLAKNPDDRPQSAEAVVAELDAVAAGLGASPARAGAPPMPSTGVPRDPDAWSDTDTTEADTDPSRALPPVPVTRARSRGRMALGAIGLAVLLVAGGFAVRLLTAAGSSGVLTVETDEPAREIVVKRHGRVVRDRTRDREFVLPPGEYTVEPADPVPGSKSAPDPVAVSADGTARVRLWIDGSEPPAPNDPLPAPPPPAPPLPAPPLPPDRKAAEALTPYADLTLKLATGKDLTVKRGEPLPAEGFAVTGIVFELHKPLRAAIDGVVFPAVAELRSLAVLQGWDSLTLTADQMDRLSRLPLAKTLTHLSGTYELTPSVLDALKRFPNLISLGGHAADADAAVLERFVREHPNLSAVHFENVGKAGKLSAPGLAALARLPLESLALAGCPVADGAFIRLLADKPKLRLVSLWGSPIDDDAVKELPRCRGASVVVLDNTKVTDAGLAHLKDMSSLRTLFVRGTKVTEAGATGFAAARPLCMVVWNGGVIEPKPGAEMDERKAAEALNPHTDLVVRFGSGKETFVKRGDPLPAEAFVVTLIGFPRVQRPPTFVADVLLPALAPLTSLQTVSVDEPGVLALTEDQLGRLAVLPCAKTIVWISCDFELTPRTLDALKRVPGLIGFGCFATTADDALLERLNELPNLKTLHLMQLGKDGKVTGRGRTAVAKLLVPDLLLTHSPAADKALFHELASMSTLRVLNLLGCPVTDDDLSELSGCSQITTLVLDQTGVTDKGLEHVAKLKGLLDVRLGKTEVTRAGAQKLADALPQCKIVWDGGVIEPKKAP